MDKTSQNIFTKSANKWMQKQTYKAEKTRQVFVPCFWGNKQVKKTKLSNHWFDLLPCIRTAKKTISSTFPWLAIRSYTTPLLLLTHSWNKIMCFISALTHIRVHKHFWSNKILFLWHFGSSDKITLFFYQALFSWDIKNDQKMKKIYDQIKKIQRYIVCWIKHCS